MSIKQLNSESVGKRKECNLCKEAGLGVGKRTDYGATIIFRLGSSKDGWFATLSPKTGSNPEQDFSIQLIPFAHLTHFSQMSKYPALAKNYGIAFAKISNAMATIMADESSDFKPTAGTREKGISVATYGKCTNWKEKKEHLHLKIFPFKGNIGQPYTVDSSFGRKPVFKDKAGEAFVKMTPVVKAKLSEERFEHLSKRLIAILSSEQQ